MSSPLTHTRPRILHVIDLPGAGWDSLVAARRCAAHLPADQRLLLIGDGQAARDAASLGLAPDYRLCPPLNRLPAVVGPLDALFKAVNRSWPVDVLHVWSDSARVLCRETFAFDIPITQQDPGPLATLDTADRERARAALGINQGETAVMLASDRPGVGDARRFTGMIGVLHLCKLPIVGLLSSRSDNYRRAARFTRGFDRVWDIVPFCTPPHCLLPAADVLYYDQGDTLTADAGPGRLTGGIAYAAALLGIPFVTTPSSLASRVLGPCSDELLAAGGLMPEITEPLMPLCVDPARRLRAGERLRQHALTASAPIGSVMDRWLAALTRGAAA